MTVCRFNAETLKNLCTSMTNNADLYRILLDFAKFIFYIVESKKNERGERNYSNK